MTVELPPTPSLEKRGGTCGPSAAYYDRIAAQYDTDLELDRWTRGAFQALVAGHVPPGALLVDYGCGTGADANWYAQHGYRVVACDPSDGMRAEFRRRCAHEIEAGSIEVAACGPRGLEDVPLPEPPSAITANFAVLCHAPDLRPLFASFHAALRPGGVVCASILNPLYWRDLRYDWWWRTLPSALRRRVTHIAGGPFDTYRHFVDAVDRAAAPLFVRIDRASVDLLPAVSQGDWQRPRTLTQQIERRLWRSPAMRSAGRYLFLVYRRCR